MELPSALQTFLLINYHTIFLWQDTLSYLKCGTADALSDLSKLPSGHVLTRPGPESSGAWPMVGRRPLNLQRDMASAWSNSSLREGETNPER